MMREVYVARVSYLLRVMDSKAIHFLRAWAVVSSISIAEAMQWSIERPFATDDESLWSPVKIVSCSFVNALVRRVYSVVLAEVPEGGQNGRRDDLSGDNKTEK